MTNSAVEESSSSSSSSYLLGMSLLLMSLVCLGTWPALLRLCSTERRTVGNIMKPPRDNRFAYLDYSLSYVISSSIPLLISALNDGEINNMLFMNNDDNENRGDDNSCYIQLVFIAMIGGTLLSLGNISMQWSTTIFGAPLTTVVAIQASLTVTIGTSINYLLEPTKTPKPLYLLCGVITFVIAILLASKAHLLYGGECNEEQQQNNNNDSSNSDPSSIELMDNNYQSTEETTIMVYKNDHDDDDDASSSSYIDDEEDIDYSCNMSRTTITTTKANPHRPSSSSSSPSMPKKALIVAIFGGCCFGFFSPAFNIAVNNPFANYDDSHDDEETITTLSVTVANLWFSFAFAISSIVFNILLMYQPPIDSGISTTTIWRYLYEDLFADRYLAICAGLICGIANMLQFKGGSIVGFATADLVQAYPLISTCWDIYLFHEFAKATITIRLYIFAMYIMYISGIVCIIASAI